MAATTPLLRVSGISVRRGSRQVLEEVDLEVVRGEVVLLVGENGAGKSTLLEAAAGLLPLSAGEVFHAGEMTRDSEGRRNRPAPFGLTLQSGGFCQDELVEERVATAVRVAGHEPDDEWTAERLEQWGLRHRAKDRIAWLSDGMMRRLGVIAGLVPALASDEPRLILLDEPSEGLDETSISTLCEQISGLAAAGHGFLIATHDSELFGLATRTLRISGGDLSETSAGRDTDGDDTETHESTQLKPREKEGFYTGNLFQWCTPLERRTYASIIPAVTAALLAFILIEGMILAIGLPEHRGWGAAFSLTPGFLAALTAPGLLRFLADSRAGDWWNAHNGGNVQMGNWMFVSVWGFLVSVPIIYLILGTIDAQTILAALGVGFIAFGSARIHAMQSLFGRQGATFQILLMSILIYPFLLIIDFLTWSSSTALSTEGMIGLAQGIGIPLAIFFFLPLIASE